METTRRALFGAGASAAFGLFPLRNISAALAQPGGASATQQAWDAASSYTSFRQAVTTGSL